MTRLCAGPSWCSASVTRRTLTGTSPRPQFKDRVDVCCTKSPTEQCNVSECAQIARIPTFQPPFHARGDQVDCRTTLTQADEFDRPINQQRGCSRPWHRRTHGARCRRSQQCVMMPAMCTATASAAVAPRSGSRVSKRSAQRIPRRTACGPDSGRSNEHSRAAPAAQSRSVCFIVLKIH